MSRNFDVLLRAEKEAGLFQVEECTRPLPPTSATHKAFTVKRPHVRIDPGVHEAEMKLVQRVFLISGPGAPHVVVFCGAEPRSGTTGICARAGENLASQIRQPVCLVDGNLRSPSLHRYFGVENIPGLTDSVSDTAPIGDFLRPIGENLRLLSAGSSDKKAQALWTSERVRARLTELRREFSFVLIDTPPANLYSDGVFFGQAADGVLLVVNSNTTHRDTARKARETLTANVKLLGAVMNNRTFPVPGFLYKRL